MVALPSPPQTNPTPTKPSPTPNPSFRRRPESRNPCQKPTPPIPHRHSRENRNPHPRPYQPSPHETIPHPQTRHSGESRNPETLLPEPVLRPLDTSSITPSPYQGEGWGGGASPQPTNPPLTIIVHPFYAYPIGNTPGIPILAPGGTAHVTPTPPFASRVPPG